MNKVNITNYYVDESGDLNLFNKKMIPVHKIGSSKTLMLGLLKIKENDSFNENFKSFKKTILDDPIFQSFPSFEKTKLYFHAKDDHIAIKREVFKYIANLNCSVQVIIRRKEILIQEAETLFELSKNKLTDRQIYNELVSRLFYRNIHKTHCNIYFATRGKTFSNNSLENALYSTKEAFCTNHGITSNNSFNVFCSQPSTHAGLQIIDYCLWALQRLYEKNDDIYFNLIKDKFKIIIDVDDKMDKGYGTLYTQKNPLSLAKICRIS